MVMTERRTGGARWTSTLFILFAAALAALLGHTDLVASASSNAALPTFSTPCFTPAAIHNGLPPQETSSYTVPATGVSKVRAVLRGQNGGGSYTSGGLGSTLVVEVPVTPGQVLHAGGLAGAPGGTGGGTVKVGSGTYTGYPGGNGGDAQYLSTAGSDGCRHALAVAGGGGGGAQATIGGTPGKGGYTSNFFMDCNDGNNGRWGEFLTGGNGGNAPAMKSLSTCDYPAHGGGGGGGSSYIDPSATKISLSAAANTGGDPVIVPVYSTTTTLSASPEFSPYGATVTLTAHVTSASPTQPVAGGTVEFFDRIVPPDGRGLIAISIGTAQVASTGDATLATASLSAGLHNLQACFLGTANTTAAYRGSCGSYQHGVSGPEQCAPAPSFTDQPTDATVAYGEYASFNATMSSLPEYIEWQVSSDGGTTWTNVPLYANLQRDTPTPGSHYTFINFIPPVSQSGLKYHAVATTCGGTTASNTATLTVNPPPIVANDKTMVVGGPVPSLDATTYDGVVLHNGDTPSGMSGRLSCTTPRSCPERLTRIRLRAAV